MRKPLVISDFAPNPWLYLAIWFSVDRRKFSQFFISVLVSLPIPDFPFPVITPRLNTLRLLPETQRQATQHACLPSLYGDWEKGIEIVYGEENIFCTGPTRAAKTEQKSFLQARRVQRSNKEWIPFICTLRVPIYLSFRMGHPYLVSLAPIEDS